MSFLTRDEIRQLLIKMNDDFNDHNLEGVLEKLHPDIYFENWTGGRVNGIEALRDAWAPWFKDHGGFHFTNEDIVIDEVNQKAVTRWRLEWPSKEDGFEGLSETKRGVDVIRLKGDKIIEKISYSKTSLDIDGQRYRLRIISM